MNIKKIMFLFSVILCFQSFGRGARTLSVKKYREQIKRENEISQNPEQKNETGEMSIRTQQRKKFISADRMMRKRIVETAFKKLNAPYLYGASGEERFDCSSFLQYVFKTSINISLPRISNEQAAYGTRIDYKNLKAGDIVAFDTLGRNRITHVGLYIGNNKFIHASSSYRKVVVSELKGFYAEKFRYGVKVI